jgi:hypothetical protein
VSLRVFTAVAKVRCSGTLSEISFSSQLGDIMSLVRINGRFLGALKDDGRTDSSQKHSFNFDNSPRVPEGWSIHPDDQIGSRLTGVWYASFDQLGLHLDPDQVSVELVKDFSITGDKLKDRLEGHLVIPAHVLDHLFKNPASIPETWKMCTCIFWGTIYRNCSGGRCVGCLSWDPRSQWRMGYILLRREFETCNTAVVLQKAV